MADLYISYGPDGGAMAYELMGHGGVAGALRKEMRVVLKPNLVVSRSAEQGATTHPEIAEGVIVFLREQGIRDITIAEGAWVGDNTGSAFQACGYTRLEQQYGVRLLDTKRDETVRMTAGGMEFQLCRTPLEADYLINLPVLKGHCQTGVTCCLKNMKGCIPDGEKRRFHSDGLHLPIALLNTLIRPHLHIVDSICGDLTFEEGGNPVESNRVLLGFDAVLVDSYSAGIIGYRPEEVEHIRLAARHGVGELWSAQNQAAEYNEARRPRNVPQRSRIAGKLAAHVEQDGACSACYAALMFALNKTGTGVLKGERVKIGQGYRGKRMPGVGVGNCASGCDRFVEGCPPKAVDIIGLLQKA